MKSRKVCIIGAEGWGSALATAVGANALIGEFDARVHIYVYDELVRYNYLSEVMNDQHENIKYLPGIKLPENLIAVNDLLEAAQNADILIFAAPQSFVKSYCNILEGKIKNTAFAVSMIKGLHHIKDGEIRLFSQAISKQLRIPCYSMMCANSAMEMAQGKLCEITIGCNNDEHARVMTTVFQTDNCKVVATNDVHGVELCGTLKDIIALGAGFIDGLRLGDNARVAALHLGIKEMMRFVKTFYPTAKMSTFFESCGVASSVASTYGDKNVTLAKNFVTSGKTMPEIESSLLIGGKLMGPLVAQEVNAFLQKENMLDKFPLFVVIHKICQNEVSPTEIVNVLRNHPDLSTTSISNLMDEEHPMPTELIPGNVPKNISDPLSLEPMKSELIEEECLTYSEEQEDWRPFYHYFTTQEAIRKTQQLNNFAEYKEVKQLSLETSTCETDPFKMECRDRERNITLVLEEIGNDATKPIACGISNSSGPSDFRIVSKSLSTDNKGSAPFDPSSTSKNSDYERTDERSTTSDEDALDLSTKAKMEDWMVDNAWLSDQLPPAILGKKGEPTRSQTYVDEQLKRDEGEEIERYSKPEGDRFQTLNFKSGDKDRNDEENHLKHGVEATFEKIKTTEIPSSQEKPFGAFESNQACQPEEQMKYQSISEASTFEAIGSLDEELSDLELREPKGIAPVVLSESQKGSYTSGEPPIKEMQIIYDKDTMSDTDFKELESEITNLSNTMHLKETEFLQQELAKLHQGKSSNLKDQFTDDKQVNFEVLMEELGQKNADYPFSDNNSQKYFRTIEEPTTKTVEKPDEIVQPFAESSQSEKSNENKMKHLSSEFEDFGQDEEVKMQFEDSFRTVEEPTTKTVEKPDKIVQPFAESSQSEKYFDKKSNENEMKHLSSDFEDFGQDEEVKMQFEDSFRTIEEPTTKTVEKPDKIVQPFAESSQSQKYFDEKSNENEMKHLSSEFENFGQDEEIKMQFEDKSNDTIKTNDELELPENESIGIYGRSVEPHAESEYQTTPQLEDVSDKQEKPLSTDLEDVRQLEVLMEDKADDYAELVDKKNKLEMPKPESFYLSVKSKKPNRFEAKLRKFGEKQLLNDSEQIRHTEKLQLEDKSIQNTERLTPDVYDKLERSDAESLGVSTSTVKRYTESTQHESREQLELEEKFLEHEKVLISDFEDERQMEEMTNHNPEYLVHENSEKLESPEDLSYNRTYGELKDEDKLITWLRNYIDEETMDKKIPQSLDENNQQSQNFDEKEDINPHFNKGKDMEWDWLRNIEKLDEDGDEINERLSELYIRESDEVDSEEIQEKLQKMHSSLTDETGQNEDLIPIHEMKKRKVENPGTPAAPNQELPLEGIPTHFPQPRSVPPTSKQQRPMPEDLPISGTDEILTTEKELSDSKRLGKKNKKAKVSIAKERSLRNDNESPSINKRVTQKDTKASRQERPRRGPAAKKASDNEDHNEEYSRAASEDHPTKSNESKLSRVTKKLNSIMRRGQGQNGDLKVSRSQSKDKKSSPENSEPPSPFPRLNQGVGANVSGNRRKVPLNPPFTTPLNPRVRIPQPPFDAREREHHTMAKSYLSPPDLTRLHSLPVAHRQSASALAQLSTSQSKQISTVNMPISSQVRGSPSFQIPKGILRSPSLAKIVSVLQLGLLAKFLTFYKQREN